MGLVTWGQGSAFGPAGYLCTVLSWKQIIKEKGICKQNFKRGKKNQYLRTSHQKISYSLSVMHLPGFSSQWRAEWQRLRANIWKIHFLQQPFRSLLQPMSSNNHHHPQKPHGKRAGEAPGEVCTPAPTVPPCQHKHSPSRSRSASHLFLPLPLSQCLVL